MLLSKIYTGLALFSLGKVLAIFKEWRARKGGERDAEGRAAKEALRRVEDVHNRSRDRDFVERVRDKYDRS